MNITEVRIFSTESRDGKLKAFATMTIDDWFVVRNIKVIQGNNGLFVAMPSRKAVDSCGKCRTKNAVGSKFCNQCGEKITVERAPRTGAEHEGRGTHMDIAHPITKECRIYIQEKIVEAYNAESGNKEPVAEEKEAPAVQPEISEEKKEDLEIQPEIVEEEKEDAQDEAEDIGKVEVQGANDIEL